MSLPQPFAKRISSFIVSLSAGLAIGQSEQKSAINKMKGFCTKISLYNIGNIGIVFVLIITACYKTLSIRFFKSKTYIKIIEWFKLKPTF